MVLLLLGVAYVGKGMSFAWRGGDCDHQSRAEEYASYAGGVYPNKRMRVAGRAAAAIHSVYPPYAFPMMGPYFWSGSREIDRVVLEVLSLGAMVVLAIQARAVLAGAGVELKLWEVIGLPLAVSGNLIGMGVGQFSMICMGLLGMQVMLQERGRARAAGICWALAMLKPHLALPFAMLFPLQRQSRGLVVGLVVLGVMSGWALWWTGVTPGAFLRGGPGTEKLTFVTVPYAAGLWVEYTGMPPRVASAGGLVVVALVVVAAGMERVRERLRLLPAAGLSGLLAYVLFYHRSYDNVLLFPLWLVCLSGFAERPTVWAFVVFGAFGFTLYVPSIFLTFSDVLLVATLVVPVAAAMLLWWRGQAGGLREGGLPGG
jgi:hypothetical protein